ncbi:hypothetical protein FA95DRAFT_1189156 [Auriscalpium vulgare]|uniref:Uncharacterized protein n=1 Tax=Auriscalpium vulgare TaxID=40419 RepID=A0ACB8RUY6_9AGAM|nr:hypothetical protein FA95DRAFT_1189156 [Auriscalpium vulgare]
MPSLRFPSEGMQVLSAIVHFLGVSILTHCLSRRLASDDFSSLQSVVQTSWARLCIVLVFLDSWLFLFLSGILIFGVGLETKNAVCSASIYLCIAFYATSKILIYFFLIEKVHLVWSPSAGRRLKSPVYIICLITVLSYTVIIALMLVGRIHFIREDNICMIGLKPYSSIPLLSYDLYINVFLNILFIWPLFRSKLVNPRVRRVAIRTLVASGVALTTSAINMIVLTVLKGQELGWVCLGSCGADVILNAVALFWVTGGKFTGTSTSGPSRAPVEISVKKQAHPPRRSAMLSPSVRDDNYDYLATSSPSKVAFNSPFASPVTETHMTHTEVSAPTANPTRIHTKRPSVLRQVTGIFRNKEHVIEEHDLKVQITTEYEVDQDPYHNDDSSGRAESEQSKAQGGSLA